MNMRTYWRRSKRRRAVLNRALGENGATRVLPNRASRTQCSISSERDVTPYLHTTGRWTSSSGRSGPCSHNNRTRRLRRCTRSSIRAARSGGARASPPEEPPPEKPPHLGGSRGAHGAASAAGIATDGRRRRRWRVRAGNVAPVAGGELLQAEVQHAGLHTRLSCARRARQHEPAASAC